MRFLKSSNEVKWARKLGVSVGENCRLLNVSFSTEPYLIKLGDHVSATQTRFETHDGGMWIFRHKHPEWDKISGITVGDNVYIGYDCIIMPGVAIGNNVIIGARSVVTKDLPDNVVAVGVPAKVIKSTNEYYKKIKKEVIYTKEMSPKDKKEYLVNYYKK
ncbi:MAG: acyltransferase [Zunongwangia sp.]|uniref:acyltransferase n=1 Tax=Zunongwangia sp. TaxID=1965325 RepID=UPI003242D362